jgi:hypothetical protein
VWLAWDLKTSKQQPAAGSTLIGLSRTAAVNLMSLMDEERKPRHFDNWLADGLKTGKGNLWEELRSSSCYLWNPVAGYQGHESGCEKNLFRDEAWNKWQPWPMVLKGPPRWLVCFGDNTTKNQSRKLDNAVEHPMVQQWYTYVPQKLRGEGSVLDQAAMDKRLGPKKGFAEAPGKPPQEEENSPVSVQPGRGSSSSGTAAASASASCPAALPGEDTRADMAAEVASVISVDLEEEAEDLASSEDAADPHQNAAGEDSNPGPQRKRRCAPVDMPGLGSEVEATKHRRRGRRKNEQAYFKHRNFTHNPVRLPCL